MSLKLTDCVKQIFNRLSFSQFVINLPLMSNTPRHIKSVDEVIDVLGGTGRAADFFRTNGPAVSMMKKRERIPAAYHLRVYLHLVDQGYEIDTESLFGYSVGMLGNDPSQAIEMHAA